MLLQRLFHWTTALRSQCAPPGNPFRRGPVLFRGVGTSNRSIRPSCARSESCASRRPPQDGKTFPSLTSGNWGIGPLVAIQAANEKALSGLGFGLMIGFRQLGAGTLPVANNLSWNFGIGALYDPSTKVLGTGIVANQPLPAG